MNQQAINQIRIEDIGGFEEEIYIREIPKDKGKNDDEAFVTLEAIPDSVVNEAGAYLIALRRTLLTALATMILSAIVGILSVSNFVLFLQGGNEFIPLYLTIFLMLWAVGLLSVSITSALYVKRDIEKCISKILENCFQQS